MPYVYKHRRPPEPWREFRHKTRHAVLLPFFAMEYSFEWLAYLLSQWSLLEVLEYAGSFSILIAVIFYFAESGERTQARHYQAWQVINTAQGKGGSGGRIDALQALNDDGVALVGVDVSKAALPGVRLDRADLHRGNFQEADMRDARLHGANLEFADLYNANLRSADLRGANLRDADLRLADLANANLAGADLSNAKLADADLTGVSNWQQATVEGAHLFGVDHPPDGFVAWAKQHGAIVEEPTTQR
ncbi:MAG TPA: pentapeptide repeat-containing protein [Tepidisphaeraceae bacterium]|nr:pentapeptide repeat-containing protein [Tepidisphaeraceae bacterium]